MIISVLTAILFVAGCATSRDGAASVGPTATCHVCRYNNDLSCVCVKVDETTPRVTYEGADYFFCSDECRTAFNKKPRKYLPQ